MFTWIHGVLTFLFFVVASLTTFNPPPQSTSHPPRGRFWGFLFCGSKCQRNGINDPCDKSSIHLSSTLRLITKNSHVPTHWMTCHTHSTGRFIKGWCAIVIDRDSIRSRLRAPRRDEISRLGGSALTPTETETCMHVHYCSNTTANPKGHFIVSTPWSLVTWTQFTSQFEQRERDDKGNEVWIFTVEDGLDLWKRDKVDKTNHWVKASKPFLVNRTNHCHSFHPILYLYISCSVSSKVRQLIWITLV